MIEYRYRSQGETLDRFWLSDKRVQVIRGPLGSGKTQTTISKVISLIASMPPSSDGVRKSRVVVIRNTYPDLKSTTIRDWLEVVPDEVCSMNMGTPPEAKLNFALEDGSEVHSEVIFLALDRPDHIRKLRGMQLTFAWLNEGKELPQAVFEMVDLRIGRFPSYAEVQEYWDGILVDTNAPDEDHWMARFETELWPAGELPDWEFFVQPGGVMWSTAKEGWVANPKAENLQNLKPGYYEQRQQGKRNDWIKVNLANEFGFVQDGRAVWPEFRREFHVAKSPLKYYKGLPLVFGWDFGLTPACVVAQVSPDGQLRILRVFTSESMGAKRFAEQTVLRALNVEFPGFRVGASWGDPAGTGRAQSDETQAIQVLNDVGFPTRPAYTNVFSTRVEKVAERLNRATMGQPDLLIDPSCRELISGLAGKYRIQRLQVAGEERYKSEPVKDKWSHPAEALQYLVLGVDEGLEREERRRKRRRRVTHATPKGDSRAGY